MHLVTDRATILLCLNREWLGDEYVVNTGYNEVAELNDIIMLYPQVKPNLPENEEGCWDFWGYNQGDNGLALSCISFLIQIVFIYFWA